MCSRKRDRDQRGPLLAPGSSRPSWSSPWSGSSAGSRVGRSSEAQPLRRKQHHADTRAYSFHLADKLIKAREDYQVTIITKDTASPIEVKRSKLLDDLSELQAKIMLYMRAFLNSNKVNLSEPKQAKSIIVLFPPAAFRKIESEDVSLVHSLCWLNTFANRCNSVSGLVSSRHSSKGMAVRGHPRSCICSSSLSMVSATSQRRSGALYPRQS